MLLMGVCGTLLMCCSKSTLPERELQAAEDQSQVSGYSPPAAARAHT